VKGWCNAQHQQKIRQGKHLSSLLKLLQQQQQQQLTHCSTLLTHVKCHHAGNQQRQSAPSTSAVFSVCSIEMWSRGLNSCRTLRALGLLPTVLLLLSNRTDLVNY
jgi:hypothetical protein